MLLTIFFFKRMVSFLIILCNFNAFLFRDKPNLRDIDVFLSYQFLISKIHWPDPSSIKTPLHYQPNPKKSNKIVCAPQNKNQNNSSKVRSHPPLQQQSSRECQAMYNETGNKNLKDQNILLCCDAWLNNFMVWWGLAFHNHTAHSATLENFSITNCIVKRKHSLPCDDCKRERKSQTKEIKRNVAAK